jgi:hypothetical protein
VNVFEQEGNRHRHAGGGHEEAGKRRWAHDHGCLLRQGSGGSDRRGDGPAGRRAAQAQAGQGGSAGGARGQKGAAGAVTALGEAGKVRDSRAADQRARHQRTHSHRQRRGPDGHRGTPWTPRGGTGLRGTQAQTAGTGRRRRYARQRPRSRAVPGGRVGRTDAWRGQGGVVRTGRRRGGVPTPPLFLSGSGRCAAGPSGPDQTRAPSKGSAELLLEVLELALQGVEARQGHRVVLRGEVDGDRLSALADGSKGGP